MVNDNNKNISIECGAYTILKSTSLGPIANLSRMKISMNVDSPLWGRFFVTLCLGKLIKICQIEKDHGQAQIRIKQFIVQPSPVRCPTGLMVDEKFAQRTYRHTHTQTQKHTLSLFLYPFNIHSRQIIIYVHLVIISHAFCPINCNWWFIILGASSVHRPASCCVGIMSNGKSLSQIKKRTT